VAPTDADWTARWWVAGEDRWHRPDVDAAVRQRLVDDTPVVETTVRVPGGDALGFAYGYAAGADAAWAGRVTNASPVPVAVALVVGPAASVIVSGTTVVVDGRHTIELSRRPSATASAPGLDGLGQALPMATTVSAELSGYVAVVVPLPHTQSASWQVMGDGVELTPLPDPDQVAAGWTRHAEEGAQLNLPPTEAVAFVRARHLVALGAATDGSVIDVADQVAAALALGWFDAALDGTEELARTQRGRGRIGDDEASTAAALAALAGWRRAGIPAAGLEHLIGPVVSGARWLARRLDRLEPVRRDGAVAALVGAAGFLRGVDQPEVAAHLDVVVASAPPRSTARLWPDDSVDTATGLIEAMVADDVTGLRLLDGWSAAWSREPVEAAGVPTPWGTAAFALRWHGGRPALLWEVEPWPDVVRTEPRLSAPSLDPTWQGSGWRGDSLLAEVALPSAIAADGSFS
jgi:hypothetical protein